MRVGEKIRQIRKQKNMTLANVSSHCGLAQATLSRIENGSMIGTLESHIKICRALGISLADLYQGIDDENNPSIDLLQSNKRSEIFIHNDRASYELLSTNILEKKMMPIILTLQPDGKTQTEQTRTGVDKFLHVVEGKLMAQIGKEQFELAEGDSLYFDGSVPHTISNMHESNTRCIIISTPPTL